MAGIPDDDTDSVSSFYKRLAYNSRHVNKITKNWKQNCAQTATLNWVFTTNDLDFIAITNC